MPGKGFVGYDFNLLEVFTVLFFKNASLIFFFYFLSSPIFAHSLSFFIVNFWFWAAFIKPGWLWNSHWTDRYTANPKFAI